MRRCCATLPGGWVNGDAADVYAPHPSGMQDIYIAGKSIVAMVPSGAVDPILIAALLNAEGSSEQVLSITDVDGAVVLPALCVI